MESTISVAQQARRLPAANPNPSSGRCSPSTPLPCRQLWVIVWIAECFSLVLSQLPGEIRSVAGGPSDCQASNVSAGPCAESCWRRTGERTTSRVIIPQRAGPPEAEEVSPGEGTGSACCSDPPAWQYNSVSDPLPTQHVPPEPAAISVIGANMLERTGWTAGRPPHLSVQSGPAGRCLLLLPTLSSRACFFSKQPIGHVFGDVVCLITCLIILPCLA